MNVVRADAVGCLYMSGMPIPRGDSSRASDSRRPTHSRIVSPFARALSVLGAFTAGDRWLGNAELAARTGLPPSTITRIAQSLASLGYLHHSAVERKFRLAASVLALGHAVLSGARVQRAARAQMRAFAEQHRLQVYLSYRRGLSLEVLERCVGRSIRPPLDLPIGGRVEIAASPMGWALLAALPQLERDYLLDNAERRSDLGSWTSHSPNEAVQQVQTRGFCVCLDPESGAGVLATPIVLVGEAPLVLACVGEQRQLTRTRVDRDLGPSMLAMAALIQDAGVAS